MNLFEKIYLTIAMLCLVAGGVGMIGAKVWYFVCMQ